jgi:DNA invertase Pin-like site-specific DNA recombinase
MLSAAAAQYRLCEQAILDTQALRVLAELLEALPGVRQSTERQVRHNTESQRLQYELADRARALGFQQVEIIDTDLGRSGAVQREGFQCLIASVAIGEVGMVLSREVSRLSRTDKDWCQLLELCQLFDTLVADAEQVYDVSTMADQLVLGIKGTLSVVELKILRQRMQQGMEAKARRGELVRLLPPGYIRDASGDIVKDPDQRVQEAIASVFGIFRQTRSVRQTFVWFKSRGLELPVNKRRDQKMTLVWQVPSQSFIRSILHNPCYAGAYVWGQRPTELVFIDGKLVKRTSKLQRPEDCRVFIPDPTRRWARCGPAKGYWSGSCVVVAVAARCMCATGVKVAPRHATAAQESLPTADRTV